MYWMALQIEAKLKKEEAERVTADEAEKNLESNTESYEGQLAGPEFEHLSQKDAMEAHFQHRRFTIAHNIKNWRKRSEAERFVFGRTYFDA